MRIVVVWKLNLRTAIKEEHVHHPIYLDTVSYDGMMDGCAGDNGHKGEAGNKKVTLIVTTCSTNVHKDLLLFSY